MTLVLTDDETELAGGLGRVTDGHGLPAADRNFDEGAAWRGERRADLGDSGVKKRVFRRGGLLTGLASDAQLRFEAFP